MLLYKVLDVHTTVQLHSPLFCDIVPGHHVLLPSSGVACPVKNTSLQVDVFKQILNQYHNIINVYK